VTARTVGFAIDDDDRPRLERLTEVFGGGNRSAFLRKALDVMETYELAERLIEVQIYGEERLAASGIDPADIPDLVERTLADPHPDAVAKAKLIVAGLHRRPTPVRRAGEQQHPTAARFAELLARRNAT
jgi:hypothetical protein